jgi:hypothetical protein
MRERERKSDKVEDLEKPVTDETAEQVKGGMTTSTSGSPILVKQIDPRTIIPCV